MKFRVFLLILSMSLGMLSFSLANSSSTSDVIIRSGGTIAVPLTAMGYKSEIRGVFVAAATFAFPHNWTIMAQTMAKYKINVCYIDLANPFGGYYGNSPYGDQLGMAINACQPLGIAVIASFSVVYNNLGNMTTAALNESLLPTDWNSPTNSVYRAAVTQQIRAIVTNYPTLNGINLDYCRYDTADEDYSNSSEAAFSQWLGQNITTWPGIYAPGGAGYNTFMEWRTIPIDQMAQYVGTLARSINPNLIITCTPWACNNPTEWRYWIGQDTAYWVANNYVDVVSPMLYMGTADSDFTLHLDTSLQQYVGGSQGKVAFAPVLSTGSGTSPTNMTIFQQQVQIIRNEDLNGWIIWAYGGPGTDPALLQYYADITQFLGNITLPNTFTMNGIVAQNVSNTSVKITWTTTLPANSTVEYSTAPLFNASYLFESATDFNYWTVNHIQGNIAADSTNVTSHSITLIGLQPNTKYYFRVQSQDSSGTATSEVLTFTTES